METLTILLRIFWKLRFLISMKAIDAPSNQNSPLKFYGDLIEFKTSFSEHLRALSLTGNNYSSLSV